MEYLTGNEEFTFHDSNVGFTIKDFWSWAYSDLLNNTYRGVMAEFLVYSSFKNSSISHSNIRSDWQPFDITSPSGRRIEVKSAAYIQSWTSDYYSQIIFDIAPKRAWSPEAGYSSDFKRNSDLFVFCVYTALTRDKSILDLDLWDFYILATSVLDANIPEQKRISLSSLQKFKPIKTNFSELGQTIEKIPL